LQQRQPISGVRPGDAPIEVQLEPPPVRTRRVRGNVLDGGRPVEGVALQYYRLPDLYPVSARTVTGPDGSFELEDVEADRVVIAGSCPGFAFARSAEVALPEEGTVEGVLVAVVDGADLEIRVKDEDGKPAANAEIDILVEDAIAARVSGATDGDGVCRLRRVPPGEYHLQVQSAGWTRVKHRKITWKGDGIPFEVVLDRK